MIGITHNNNNNNRYLGSTIILQYTLDNVDVHVLFARKLHYLFGTATLCPLIVLTYYLDNV